MADTNMSHQPDAVFTRQSISEQKVIFRVDKGTKVLAVVRGEVDRNDIFGMVLLQPNGCVTSRVRLADGKGKKSVIDFGNGEATLSVEAAVSRMREFVDTCIESGISVQYGDEDRNPEYLCNWLKLFGSL